MPTWDIPAKNTTSPGRRCFRETYLPFPQSIQLECGSDTPTFLYTYMTKPEQSKPAGEAPAQR